MVTYTATAPRRSDRSGSIVGTVLPVLIRAVAILAGAVRRRVLPHVVTVAALSCFVLAAWLWTVPAGLVTLGLALLVLDWRIRG